MSNESNQSDQEGGLERICGIVALLFWSILLIELLGVTIIVGVSDISPRDAAKIMLLPAFGVWVMVSSFRSARRAAITLFPPLPWW